MVQITTKSTGQTVSAAEFNQLPDELENVVTAGSGTPASGTLDQVAKAITDISSNADYYTDSGAADAYVLTSISPNESPQFYRNGMRIRFRTSNANTGASTVNVATLGVKNIKKEDGASDPDAGDISSAIENVAVYDGTNFRLKNKIETATSTSQGIQYSAIPSDKSIISNGTDTQHDIDISTGISVLNDGIHTILSSTLTKQIDANWTAGDDQGGFPSGLSLSADTWYRVFVIYNPTTGVTDAGFDTSDTATNLLADATGYTKYSHRGWILTDGSSNILQFNNDENHRFVWNSGGGYHDIAAVLPTTSATAHTLAHMPKDVIGILNVYYQIGSSGGTGYGLVTEIRKTDNVPTSTLQNLVSSDTGTYVNITEKEIQLKISSSNTIRSRFTSAAVGSVFSAWSTGWYDLEIK